MDSLEESIRKSILNTMDSLEGTFRKQGTLGRVFLAAVTAYIAFIVIYMTFKLPVVLLGLLTIGAIIAFYRHIYG